MCGGGTWEFIVLHQEKALLPGTNTLCVILYVCTFEQIMDSYTCRVNKQTQNRRVCHSHSHSPLMGAAAAAG